MNKTEQARWGRVSRKTIKRWRLSMMMDTRCVLDIAGVRTSEHRRVEEYAGKLVKSVKARAPMTADQLTA